MVIGSIRGARVSRHVLGGILVPNEAWTYQRVEGGKSPGGLSLCEGGEF